MLQALLSCGCDVDGLDPVYLRTMSDRQLTDYFGIPGLVQRYSSEYTSLLLGGPLLFDSNTGAVLETLRSYGIGLGLVTSSSSELTSIILAQCGFLEFFNGCTVTFSDCLRIKPNPDPILLALDKLSASHEATLFVGDSESDIIASRAAGVAFAQAGWSIDGIDHLGGRVPDMILSSINDILKHTCCDFSK